MKTKKINLSLAQSVLSKDQMKKIMASSGEQDGDCVSTGDACQSWNNINCCSGNICDNRGIGGYTCYKQ